jgi:3-methylfumaryl-CoA hydratase
MTIRDEFFVPAGLAVAEEMDIIFRKNAEGPEPLPPPQPRPAEAVWRRVIQADPPFLFRYSALTYNSHRIHYDLTYTTKQEGYPTLLVHGPLQANLMLELVRQNDARPIAEFSCRAQRPVFEGGPFSVEGAPTPDRTGVTMWVLDRDGALSMTASVKFA